MRSDDQTADDCDEDRKAKGVNEPRAEKLPPRRKRFPIRVYALTPSQRDWSGRSSAAKKSALRSQS
jgi:hypothetical protein